MPRKNAPRLVGLREETNEGRYTLVRREELPRGAQEAAAGSCALGVLDVGCRLLRASRWTPAPGFTLLSVAILWHQVLEFESTLAWEEWEKRQPKIQSFFGPGANAARLPHASSRAAAPCRQLGVACGAFAARSRQYQERGSGARRCSRHLPPLTRTSPRPAHLCASPGIEALLAQTEKGIDVLLVGAGGAARAGNAPRGHSAPPGAELRCVAGADESPAPTRAGRCSRGRLSPWPLRSPRPPTKPPGV